MTKKIKQFKLKRIQQSHKGWVSTICVDPTNLFYCTGSHDETIKIFGLEKGEQKLTFHEHIGAVKSLQLSPKHPYLFSGGEDRNIRCFDLEVNKMIKSYHGHLSGVNCISLHPTENIIISGGRDSVLRLWDMRSKENIEVYEGHNSSIFDIKTKNSSPQIISCSEDGSIKCWDMVANKCLYTFTHHEKAVRCVELLNENEMISASYDSIKIWKNNEFQFDLDLPNEIITSVKSFHSEERNETNIVTTSLNGNISIYSYSTDLLCSSDSMKENMKNCQKKQSITIKPQKDALESENGILCSSFDMTGNRLLIGCNDKTIKTLFYV